MDTEKVFFIRYAKTCVVFFFLSKENSPETRKLYALWLWYNVWSFATCVNHVCNHKSHAIWMHKTEESRLSFRYFILYTYTKIILLPHIFNFDFIIIFFFILFFERPYTLKFYSSLSWGVNAHVRVCLLKW